MVVTKKYNTPKGDTVTIRSVAIGSSVAPGASVLQNALYADRAGFSNRSSYADTAGALEDSSILAGEFIKRTENDSTGFSLEMGSAVVNAHTDGEFDWLADGLMELTPLMERGYSTDTLLLESGDELVTENNELIIIEYGTN